VPLIVAVIVGQLTVVVAVALSLDELISLVDKEMLAVLLIIVPWVKLGATTTTSVNMEFPGEKVALEQVIVPPAPTAGVVQDQPAGEESEKKVVPAGNVLDSETEVASLGPVFVTVIV